MEAPQNPYPGLRPFRDDEEYLFFGRESQVDRMVDKLGATRFLAVVGSSGSGKSSLVNCGLRPALHRGLMSSAGTSWRVAQFRPGGDPMRALAGALSRRGLLFKGGDPAGMPLEDIVAATLSLSDLGLVDLYEQARLPRGTNLLVVVDQFEELFRYGREPGRSEGAGHGSSESAVALVNLLLASHTQKDQPIHVVLTMRSDFLGDCARFYGLPEAINEGQYLVPRMTREERRAAIVGPARVAGTELSALLVTRLINETADDPDQLSILQHALNRTWARWRHHGDTTTAVSTADYEATGTMARALDQHAEEAFGELEAARARLVCEKVFKAVTDKGTDARGIRRPLRLEQLQAITGASPLELEAVLAPFREPTRSFLMPPMHEALGPETYVDISHESLMRVWQRLRGWTDEEAESARVFRRIRETAALHQAGAAGLWRDPDLQLALDWRLRVSPTGAWAGLYGGGFDDAIVFIDASKLERDKDDAMAKAERRWRSHFVVPGGVCLLIAYAWATTALRQPVKDLVEGALWNEPAVRPVEQLVNKLAQERALERVVAAPEHPGAIPAQLIAAGLPIAPLFFVGLGLHRWARQRYLAFAVPRILRRVQAAVPATPPVAKPSAPIAGQVLGSSYGSFGRRTLASLLDGAISLFLYVGCVFGIAMFDVLFGTHVLQASMSGWLVFLLWMVVTTLLDARTVSSRFRGTLGMMALGLVVTTMEGEPLPGRRAALRRMYRLLSYNTVIGVLIQPFTKRHQALHDLLSRSVVLRRAEPVPSPSLGMASRGE